MHPKRTFQELHPFMSSRRDGEVTPTRLRGVPLLSWEFFRDGLKKESIHLYQSSILKTGDVQWEEEGSPKRIFTEMRS